MEKKDRIELWMKTEGRCAYCGKFLKPNKYWNNFEIDHMHPRIQGGANDKENLIASCIGCNHKKGGRTVEEYKEHLIRQFKDKLSDLYFHKNPTKYLFGEILTHHQKMCLAVGIQQVTDEILDVGVIKFYFERLRDGEENLD